VTGLPFNNCAVAASKPFVADHIALHADDATTQDAVRTSTLRVRRYRERRREGVCCLTVEMNKAGIADAIARAN
jgi:hypothetical protein